LLAISWALEEEPWSGPNSFQATLGANPHTSWELDQIVFLESDPEEWTDEEPVIEAFVCTVAGASAALVVDLE